MIASPRYVLSTVGTFVFVGLFACLVGEWVTTGDFLEAVRSTAHAGFWGLVVAAGLLLVVLAGVAIERLWLRGQTQFLRLEHGTDNVWIARVRRGRRSDVEKVLERQDITRTVSVSHVNGDALDPEEGVQLHDREPAIRMGLFGEIPTEDDAELLARVGHDQLVGAFGRDLAVFLRSRPLVRCEYSLDDETLWRVLPGHQLKPVEPGITFEGDKIVWQIPEQDRDE